MFSIVRILFLIVSIMLIVLFVYFLIYSRRINEKITRGEMGGRRMPDIPGAIRTAIIAALVVYAVILTLAVKSSENKTTAENRNSFAVIDLSDYTYSAFSGTLLDKDASYVKYYSRENNEGYRKSVSQEGDFIFTVFTRTGEHDAYHPDFFCFVDYGGGETGNYSLYEHYEFVDTLTLERLGGIGSGGSSIPDSFFVIGNLNDADSFEIALSILDSKGEEAFMETDRKAYEEDKGNFPQAMDYAISKGSVVITIE